MDPKLLGAILLVVVFAWMFLGRKGDVDGTAARKLVADGALLLDVRTPGEFSDRHIEGAVNIPVEALAGRMAEVGPKDRPVVVYCRSGNRSASAKRQLLAAGYASVHDLGPIGAW